MARKVFISVLGATNYRYCDYQKDGKSYGDVRFIQEATLNYLNCKSSWNNNDIAYILLTRQAEKNNWEDRGQIDRNTHEVAIDPITHEPFKGLKSCLEQMQLPFNVHPVRDLPDGNDEQEIWQIFNRVFSLLQEGDELYFDITHGFRYIPMLILVLCNYSKFIKQVVVRSITYGNYEVASTIKHGLIVDLMPLTILQDWAYASAAFIESGNCNKLCALSKERYQPLLSNSKGKDEDARLLRSLSENLSKTTDDFMTCRGINIVSSKNISKLLASISNVKSTIVEPLNPLLDKIKNSFAEFDIKENVVNGFSAAKWCLNNGLYQQAITILQENIVTYFCIEEQLDWHIEKERNIVEDTFNIWNKVDFLPEEEWDIQSDIQRVCSVMSNTKIRDIARLYKNIRDIRNDYNHSGMRNNPMRPDDIKSKIGSFIYETTKMLDI